MSTPQALDPPMKDVKMDGLTTPAMRRRVLAAASAGTFVEYYDFAIYSSFAPVLATVFFPGQSPTAALLSTFAVFAGAFVARPLGALLWGPLGDRIGRQRTLVLILALMALSTIGLGLIPGYASIGVLAPVLLVAMRLLQGISAGGELPGAAIFTGEYSPVQRRGFLVSWLQVATVVAMLTGILVSVVLAATLSAEALESWGWRIPFLLAGPLGLIGFYVRRRLEDSPQFEAIQRVGKTARSPIRSTVRGGENLRRLGIAAAYGMPIFVGYYLLTTFMPTFFRSQLEFTQAQSLLAVAAAAAVHIAVIPTVGAISDRVGRKLVLRMTCTGFLVLTYPSFLLLTSGSVEGAVLGMMLLAVPSASAMGNYLSASMEQFPTRTRYTGFALTLGVCVALFSGTAPYVSTWLIAETGSLFAPGFYLMLTVVPSFIVSFFVKETAARPLAA